MNLNPRIFGQERYMRPSRSWATRPTPSTNDPYPFGVNRTTGNLEYWEGTKWVIVGTGTGFVDHGLLEPGLIMNSDGFILTEAGWGFNIAFPETLITTRNLYTSEDIRLGMLQNDGMTTTIVPQPADIVVSVPIGVYFGHVFYFTLTPGNALFAGWLDLNVMAQLGIYDNDENRWVDQMSIMVAQVFAP